MFKIITEIKAKDYFRTCLTVFSSIICLKHAQTFLLTGNRLLTGWEYDFYNGILFYGVSQFA